jgi:hypothetical protein
MGADKANIEAFVAHHLNFDRNVWRATLNVVSPTPKKAQLCQAGPWGL